MNPPPPKKGKISTFGTSSGRGGGVQSFTQRSAHTHYVEGVDLGQDYSDSDRL